MLEQYLPVDGWCSGCSARSDGDVHQNFGVVIGQPGQLLSFPLVSEHGAYVACNHANDNNELQFNFKRTEILVIIASASCRSPVWLLIQLITNSTN